MTRATTLALFLPLLFAVDARPEPEVPKRRGRFEVEVVPKQRARFEVEVVLREVESLKGGPFEALDQSALLRGRVVVDDGARRFIGAFMDVPLARGVAWVGHQLQVIAKPALKGRVYVELRHDERTIDFSGGAPVQRKRHTQITLAAEPLKDHKLDLSAAEDGKKRRIEVRVREIKQ